MISGANEEELTEAIGRGDVLLEFIPKIKQLQQENKQLKDNWNKLKECLKDVMNSCDADDKDFVETILDIMKELEQGSGSNE